MRKKRPPYPLEKVTLHLYKDEFSRLRELHPDNGSSEIVRTLVHQHILVAEARAKEKLDGR